MFECTNAHAAPIQKTRGLTACPAVSNRVAEIQEMGWKRIKIRKYLMDAKHEEALGKLNNAKIAFLS